MGEIEDISFLENEVVDGQGPPFDSQVPALRAKVSFNRAFLDAGKHELNRDRILRAHGATQNGCSRDFALPSR
ncbi:hypothetical protein [Aliiroseovarius subalbicans]|uniref:hypothetical protein n=1 Tax=Aliiroseovarius subalbicans TaxID=2925840 RepID=UPI001F569B6F|nr:hypothetical protein [Aliiroseovarius subalbicans]MCI2399506.1 hypothetical protein [Aliiroseovarius subalbicans]